VWLVGNLPLEVRQQLNLPNDAKGIDGVFRTHAQKSRASDDLWLCEGLKRWAIVRGARRCF
jgi:hypothetical protein